MKLKLRSFLFWPHLVSGLLAGLVIALLSVTGVLLVFEKPAIRWADPQRLVSVPDGAVRLPVDEQLARATAAKPGKAVTAVTVASDPAAATVVSFGREDGVYVNPYSGEVGPFGGQQTRTFFAKTTELHRFLLGQGERREVGKAITGASNLVFFFLALTGLYLWFPRKWAWRAYRPALWFRNGLKGKARDFSWHNVIGAWSLPALLVITASGAVISYKWASDAVYRITGNEPPAQGGGGPPPERRAEGERRAPGGGAPATDERRAAPTELPSKQGNDGTAGSPASAPLPETPGRSDSASVRPALPVLDPLFRAAAAAIPEHESIAWRAPSGAAASKPGPVALTVRLANEPPQRANVTLNLDPATQQIVSREGYAEANAGRKARMWMRFLHTGEALGVVGQALAALASFGALFLVYTGTALAVRRLWPRKRRVVEAQAPQGSQAA